MKDRLTSKAIVAAVVTFVLLMVSLVAMVFSGVYLMLMHAEREGTAQVEAAASAYVALAKDADIAEANLRDNMQRDMALVKSALSPFMTEEGYTGPGILGDTLVVRIQDGVPIFPEGTPKDLLEVSLAELEHLSQPGAETSCFSYDSEDGDIDESTGGLVFAQRVADDLFCMKLVPMEDYYNYIELHTREQEISATLERSYDAALLVIDRASESLDIDLESTRFEGVKHATDIGLTHEFIENKTGEIIIDATPYSCWHKDIDDSPYSIVLMKQEESPLIRIIYRLGFILLVMAVTLVAYGAYLLFVQGYVRDKVLPADWADRYAPARLRKTTIGVLALTAVFIFAASCFIQSVGMLYEETLAGDTTLNQLFQGLQERQQSKESDALVEEERFYVERGNLIASLVTQYPELATRDALAEMSDAIGADYLMLFDPQGKQVACSNDYTGYTLGIGQGEGSADFRRLLHGVPYVVHDPARDPVTGLNYLFVGVTLPMTEGQEGHGALIMAVPAEAVEGATNVVTIDDLLELVTLPDEISLAADASRGSISYTSNPMYKNWTISDIGLREASLRDGYMDFVNLDYQRYFIITAQKDDTVYYYGRQPSSIFANVTQFGIIASVAYAAVFCVMSFVLLRGYTQERFEQWRTQGAPLDDGETLVTTSSDGRRRRAVDPSKRWALSFDEASNITPERKAIVLMLVLVVLLIAIVVSSVSAEQNSPYIDSGSLALYILRGNWMRGFNLFALCAILMVMAIGVLLIVVARELLKLLSHVLDSRGETICRLIYSLIKYVIVLAMLYHIFGYLGFDARTRLASLGIVSIALSFGAQSLVQDIITGIFIVFEGEFQVGDIIVIDGYRGTVQEIGVRSTKLIGRGKNIKIIDNRDIKNVVNLTRMNSWYALEVRVPATESLTNIERILARELPLIAERHSDVIISGPTYRGVLNPQTGVMIPSYGLSILTECREADYHEVERIINREIMLLFQREGIQMK